MSKLNIAIIFGGKSSEHEVSRISTTSIINNIDKEKYNIYLIGITKMGEWMFYDGDIEKINNGQWEKEAVPAFITPDTGIKGIVKLLDKGYEKINIDVAFPVLHGLYGEDGTIQGLLQLGGIPYVGPGVLASAIGMDKIYAKIVCKEKGLPQSNFIWFNKIEILNEIEKVVSKIEVTLGYPCFVKPSNSGSSIGINKVHDRTELIESIKVACDHDNKILIEEFINARELECAVLGNQKPIASAVGEVMPSHEFYDYEAKYFSDSKTCIPANIDSVTTDRIKELAIEFYKAIDAKGMSRVDFFISFIK